MFALQFLVGGARLGEPGVLVTFAERPEDRHRALNFALQPPPIGGSGLSITGDSYRMRAHQDAINALRPAITGGEFP